MENRYIHRDKSRLVFSRNKGEGNANGLEFLFLREENVLGLDGNHGFTTL